jgi:hypothetical protein
MYVHPMLCTPEFPGTLVSDTVFREILRESSVIWLRPLGDLFEELVDHF